LGAGEGLDLRRTASMQFCAFASPSTSSASTSPRGAACDVGATEPADATDDPGRAAEGAGDGDSINSVARAALKPVKQRRGRWSQTESRRFEVALAELGLNRWEDVAARVQSRSVAQVRVHGASSSSSSCAAPGS